VTAWGVIPARGHRCYCGTCGLAIAFREERRLRSAVESELDRVTLVIQGHLVSSARCRAGGTFEGRVVVACRCEKPLRLPREDGLFCARCEGVVAPDVAIVAAPRRRRRLKGGSQ
jgi:hypothetical protein